jgi:hypothetical protein
VHDEEVSVDKIVPVAKQMIGPPASEHEFVDMMDFCLNSSKWRNKQKMRAGPQDPVDLAILYEQDPIVFSYLDSLQKHPALLSLSYVDTCELQVLRVEIEQESRHGSRDPAI